MFPVDYQVNVHTAKGVRSYTLLENQGDRHLIVLPADALEALMQYLRRSAGCEDALVELLAEAVLVLERRRGHELSRRESLRALAASRHPVLRRAGLMRQPLAADATTLSPEDLAWAFGLEAAQRRVSLPD